jgi:hypothetical protein
VTLIAVAAGLLQRDTQCGEVDRTKLELGPHRHRRGEPGDGDVFRDAATELAHRSCRHVRRRSKAVSEEVGFMTRATVERVFEVDAPLEEAWHRLAEVERWPEWAPHITSVTVSPPGELGPTSSGAFQIKRLGAAPSACRCGSRQSVGSGSAGCLGSASTTTIGSSRRARQRHGWNGWSSSMGPSRCSLRVSVMLLQVGTRCSQRPRQISAPAGAVAARPIGGPCANGFSPFWRTTGRMRRGLGEVAQAPLGRRRAVAGGPPR